MSINNIEAAVNRAVQQMPADQRPSSDVAAQFAKLFAQVLSETGLGSTTGAGTASTGSTHASASATQLYSAHSTSSSLWDDPSAPAMEALSGDEAIDVNFNAREAVFRERLNMPELERRLQAAAKEIGVEYSSTDLDGILRNSGYDAAHFGSSDRYMAQVEKFTGLAIERYKERAGNAPNQG